MRRIFLQGLPQWLREALVIVEEKPLPDLVDTAQKIWHLQCNSASVEGPPVAFELSVRPRNNGHKPVSNVKQTRPYCSFHKVSTHDTQDCRASRNPMLKCDNCSRTGHLANNCWFPRVRGSLTLAAREAMPRGHRRESYREQN